MWIMELQVKEDKVGEQQQVIRLGGGGGVSKARRSNGSQIVTQQWAARTKTRRLSTRGCD